MSQILLVNKPFNVLTQFTDQEGRQTLAHYIKDPAYKGFYPAGRLDRDSEGLVILTNDGKLQHRISHPSQKLEKTYLVQVDGDIEDDSLAQLREGVELKDGLTLPSKAKRIEEPKLWERNPPIRVRQNIPTSWIKLSITEGRNRQVRRMTAAIGFPTLRLVRSTIGPWQLDGLSPGEYRHIHVNLPSDGKSAAARPSKSRRPKSRRTTR